MNKHSFTGTRSDLYWVISIMYLVLYITLASLVTVYVLQKKDIIVAIFLIPFILFRIFSVGFALAFYTNTTGWCCNCTKWFCIVVVGLQSLFVLVAAILRILEFKFGIGILSIFLLLDSACCLYLLLIPKISQSSNDYSKPRYMVVPMQYMMGYP